MSKTSQLRIEFEPTPVYFANKKAYDEGWQIICNEGGSRCFAAGTLVRTPYGLTPIEQIQAGDIVETKNEFNKVLDVFEFANKKEAVRIKLKNGYEIKCTSDHKFFFRGRWVEIKNILSLLHENDTKI